MSGAEDTPISATAECPGQSQTLSPSACSQPPGDNGTPRADRDDTPTSRDHTPSPHTVDDTLEESFQNPEPPKELAELLNADNIGGTVFSKHWLFTTLMRLLEVIVSIGVTGHSFRSVSIRCTSDLFVVYNIHRTTSSVQFSNSILSTQVL